MAFVTAIPVSRRSTHAVNSPRRTAPTASAAPQHDDAYDAQHWADLDTLRGFEALCVRTQAAVCSLTAAADGLGTFEAVPSTASGRARAKPPRVRHMRGGLAFERAVVNVWRTPAPKGRGASASASATDAVGLSLRLQPRHRGSPALRADVHYYQRGAAGTGAWWFSGAADLTPGKAASPNVFSRDVHTFLANVLPPVAGAPTPMPLRYTLPAACAETPDRAGAFAFVVRVVDVLLPAYLPLVDGTQHLALDTTSTSTPSSVRRRRPHARERQRFGVPGGASCESDVALAHEDALGWWRFTLAPRAGTPQSSLFYRMRNSHAQSGM